jgi:hypothetical protein
MTEISWKSLNNIYSDSRLSKKIEQLEKELNVVDETKFFATLVNMSVSKKQPFHRWVRYREGYAGELVKELLKRYPVNSANDFVLDPMCGSGSTNVACRELGLTSVGLDVNPFAVLAATVKNYSTDKKFVTDVQDKLAKIISRYNSQEAVSLNAFEFGLRPYFDEDKILSLARIKRAINAFSSKRAHNFFTLALLAIVEDCSNRKKDGNGLATRPSTIQSVLQRFQQQCIMMLDDLKSVNAHKVQTTTAVVSAIEMADFLGNTKIELDKKLGAVIFSPPYANSFDYFESYKLELVFGEYSKLDELQLFRKGLIRNYRLSHKTKLKSEYELVTLLANEIEQKIPEKEKITGRRDGRTRLVPNMLCAYFEDMSKVLENCFSNLKKKGMVHIVVDQSSYVGVPIPTDSILALIGRNIGFEVVSVINCRRAATSGQQLTQFPYLGSLLRETIVSLKKN